MAGEPTVDEVRVALGRTLAARTARIALTTDLTWRMPEGRERREGRQGRLARPLISAGTTVGRRVLKAAAKGLDWRHLVGEGVLDIAGRRFMLDHGSYARLHADGREWSGRSGRLLETLPTDPDERPTPLWLLDLLQGATEAHDDGADDVRGVACRRLRVTADLGRASAATPHGLAPPKQRRFEDLLALHVDVWLDDDAHVRRVRFVDEHRTDTLELWDLGVPVDDLDWTRLPTFRSPEEAAELERRRAR